MEGRPAASIFNDRHVGSVIRPDHLGSESAPVFEFDVNLILAVDHVIIRDDVAVLAHDKPGSLALIGLLTLLLGTAKEKIKPVHRVRGIAGSAVLFNIHDHDCRSDLFVNGGISVVQLMRNILRGIRSRRLREKRLSK